jgi:hypothetical protein
MKVITSTDPDKRMHRQPTTQDKINKLRKWIEQGAKNNAANRPVTALFIYLFGGNF